MPAAPVHVGGEEERVISQWTVGELARQRLVGAGGEPLGGDGLAEAQREERLRAELGIFAAAHLCQLRQRLRVLALFPVALPQREVRATDQRVEVGEARARLALRRRLQRGDERLEHGDALHVAVRVDQRLRARHHDLRPLVERQ